MTLYKFIERKYCDDFFNTGSLRLGTIHSFRDTVEYGEHIGDEDEGIHHIKRSVDNPVTHSKENNEPIISEFFNLKGDGDVTISNMSFVVPRKSADAFIFCTSYLFTEALFKMWNDKKRFDACYEITDVKLFIESISQKIELSAYFVLETKVAYIGKEIDWQSPQANIHPGLTKFNEYSWQKEHRMVWNPKGPCLNIKPWLIDVPEARDYCKPYATIENNEITYIA